MNSIRIGTIPWCSHQEIQSFDVVTVLKCNMHLLCIFYSQVRHSQIVAAEEGHSLKQLLNQSKTLQRKILNIMLEKPWRLMEDPGTYSWCVRARLYVEKTMEETNVNDTN